MIVWVNKIKVKSIVYILEYLAALVCLCSTLTGASYKIEPEDQPKRSSWQFSNLFACCCNENSPSNTKVIHVSPSAEKLNRETIVFDELIRQEGGVVKRPITSLSSLKVLIVDGSSLPSTMLRHICKYHGISISNIVSVKSGEEAIEKFLESSLKGETFHVIFIEENMGDGISGAETASEIIKLNVERKPVIISTSDNCSNESMTAYERRGMNGMFFKPFNTSAFMPLLLRHFRFSKNDLI